MLGIVIGNASVITMIGVGEGTQTLATDQFKNLGPNTLFILPGSPKAQNIRPSRDGSARSRGSSRIM